MESRCDRIKKTVTNRRLRRLMDESGAEEVELWRLCPIFFGAASLFFVGAAAAIDIFSAFGWGGGASVVFISAKTVQHSNIFHFSKITCTYFLQIVILQCKNSHKSRIINKI